MAAMSPSDDLSAALAAIDPDKFLGHIRTLASDEYEGRALGGRGEELSVQYITEQFKAIGLQPGNPDGTYVQKVPIAGIVTQPSLTLSAGGQKRTLNYPDDFVASSARLVPEVRVDDAEIVFVGYGVVAPEYGWDDYKDVDVRGKTILMLVSDPAIPHPDDPSRLDESMFKGKAMTYYGRWTYKYEIAAKKGAAAAIIIHETGPAGYPYSVVRSSWAKETFVVNAPDKNMGAVPVRSWITLDVARMLLADAGQDFDALKKAALNRDFRPVELAGARASFDIRSEVRTFESSNVLARLDGSDPAKKDEWIIYSAHWDHLGKVDDAPNPPRVYHGAVDNASGIAAVLALAQAFKALAAPVGRSILFFAPTAEESGLLGAKFYAEHPLYPLAKTLANINIDGVNMWGRTRDIENMVSGHSTLDGMLAEAAARQGRVVVPDTQPEKGMFYRADHFEFAKEGIPVIYTSAGKEVIGRPAGFGQEKFDEYVTQHYHQPSDDLDAAWDLGGAVEDTALFFDVGYRLATGAAFPQWNEGGEFKPKRDAMLAAE
ncbi:MAG: M28 family peptidase [Gluconacetobacter diazotrophicus]|nr:M28 family peptidase [Gluconacetobacter diazotrophicus]